MATWHNPATEINKVVHFEIPYEDETRAKQFYQDVFGWQIVKMPEMDYYMVTTTDSDPQTMRPKTPGAINGGMLKKDPTGPYPMLVIAVEDVDAHEGKVEAAGGKVVMPKIPIGNFGYYARIADPEGNIIGIWEARQG